MCVRYAPTQPDATQFPIWQSDYIPETRAAQGDREQPMGVVSTVTVEDISPITYRKLRKAARVTPWLLVASSGPERLPLGAFAAIIPSGKKGTLPGEA